MKSKTMKVISLPDLEEELKSRYGLKCEDLWLYITDDEGIGIIPYRLYDDRPVTWGFEDDRDLAVTLVYNHLRSVFPNEEMILISYYDL